MSKSFHWKTKINPEFQTNFCSSPGFLDLNEDSSKGKETANVCGIDKLKKKLWKLEPPKKLVIYPLNFDEKFNFGMMYLFESVNNSDGSAIHIKYLKTQSSIDNVVSFIY